VARGRILAFSIDLLRRLQNDLALPCECVIKRWIPPTQYRFFALYDYPFLSYMRLNLITLPSPGMVNVHAPCHVTYQRGGN